MTDSTVAAPVMEAISLREDQRIDRISIQSMGLGVSSLAGRMSVLG